MLLRSPFTVSFHSTHLISLSFCITLLRLGGDQMPRSADGHQKVHMNVRFMSRFSPFLLNCNAS